MKTKTQLKVEYIPIDKLNPFLGNPRKNEENVESVVKSIEAFGYTNPILVRRENNEIIAGHTRIKALKQIGETEAPVIFLDLSEVDARTYGIFDNKSTENAQWDLPKLADMFVDLDQFNVDMDLTGFSADEILEIAPATFEPQSEEDVVPDPPAEPITKTGDLWLLGEHRVLCGDSTKKNDVGRLCGREKADMVFTDPPYNISSDSKNFAKDVSKAMRDIADATWDKDFDPQYTCSIANEYTKDDSAIYIFTSHFLFGSVFSLCTNWADFVSYCVWVKPNPMPALSKRHWTWNTELCVYATKGSKRVVNFPNEGHALSGWAVTKKSDGTHPTQKPIELCQTPILFNTNVNGLVLDLFLGSGSTLIACEKTKRKCYGIEIDPIYVDVIVKRWQDYTGKKAVLQKETVAV